MLFTTGLAACLNKTEHLDDKKRLSNIQQTFEGDTIIYLSKSNNKIELLKPDNPKLEYLTEKESAGRLLDGVYISDNNPISLKDGELIVYNRFYEVDKKLTFKDSLIILREDYTLGKISSVCTYNYKDSIFITKYFYDNGNPRSTEINKANNETEQYLWYRNGQLVYHCIRKKLVKVCDFWTENGYFEQRQRYTYPNVNADMTISQEVIDRENKLIKKIQ